MNIGHWRVFAEYVVEWRAWGIGISFSFGGYFPKEYSVDLEVGPFCFVAGIKERMVRI